MARVGIEHGNDGKPYGIVRHGEQKQERYRRVPGSKDEPGHQPGQRDVGGGRNAPAACQLRAADDGIEPQIDEHRAHHPPESCQKRIDRLSQRVQIAARQATLGYFHSSDTEKKDHEQLVHHEMEAHPSEERLFNEGVVAGRVEVGPEQGNHYPCDQRYRKFTQQIDPFSQALSFQSAIRDCYAALQSRRPAILIRWCSSIPARSRT